MSEVVIPFLEVRIGTNVLIPFLGVVGAAFLGLWWNFHSAAESRRQPFLAKQLDLCLEAVGIVATLATTRSKAAFEGAHARFLVLYWGPLPVVENEEVAAAMVHVREKLDALVADGAPLPLEDLRKEAYELDGKVRKLILKAWRIRKLEDDMKGEYADRAGR